MAKKKLSRVTVKAFSSPEIEKEVATVLKDALRQSSPKIYEALSAGLTRDEMISRITEITGKAESYASTLTDTGLSIIGRERIAETAKDLGLTWYRYIGGVIDTSRDFCIERDGGYYNETEIEEWADEDWSGKIEGTDAENIFSYCGGWNCRHDLIPVIDSIVPDSDKERVANVAEGGEAVEYPEFERLTQDELDAYRTELSEYVEARDEGNTITGDNSVIELYTTQSYRPLNAYLKNPEGFPTTGVASKSRMEAFDKLLEQAIENSPPTLSKELYRVENFNEDRLKTYLSGKPFVQPTYYSTTYDFERSSFTDNYAGTMSNQLEKRNKIKVVIKPSAATRAVNIENISDASDELEVLYQKGTKFKGIRYDEATRTLYLEEL